jgi:tyrosyl-tRNA synthetase
MNPLQELTDRGLISQTTNGVDEHLNEPRTIYCGFDPTADSLHIGSLVPLLAMKRLQDAGHKPVLLVGGATGMIGDPSFKSSERKLNSDDVVQSWTESLKNQVSRFVDFENKYTGAVIVNNFDWVKEISVIDFLRDTGKHFHVNAMIQKESVKQRLIRDGEGISFTEFSYMLLQSLDFAHLNRSHNCTVQIGGSDQWGNIVGGIDLTKKQNGKQGFGVTLPLVTKSDGTKFGKTESGTIWLDANKTSPFNFFQFWMNTADDDVYKFLKFFTFLTVEDINSIENADKLRGGKPQAQEILAKEVTTLVHGAEATKSAQRITSALFSGDVSDLTQKDFEQLESDGMEKSIITEGETAVSLIADISNLAKSRKMAREHINNGAIKVNGVVLEVSTIISKELALFNRFSLIKMGKKKHHLIVWT